MDLRLICVLYVVTWLIAPPLAFDSIFRYLAIFCCIIWFFLDSMSEKREKISDRTILLQNYVFVGVLFILTKISFNIFFDGYGLIQAINYNIHYLIIVAVGYMAGSYFHKDDKKSVEIIFFYIVILTVIFSLTTATRDSAYISATRELKISTPAEREYARTVAMKGIGTFGFFSFSSLLLPIVFSKINLYKGFKKTLMVLATVILFIGIISSGYAIAVITSIVGCSLYLFSTFKNSGTRFIVFLCAVLCIASLSMVYPIIFKFFTSIFSGTMFENKFFDLTYSINQGELFGSFKERWIRYEASIDGMLSSFFIGSYVIFQESISGGHSSILDVTSQYGLWGLMLWGYLSVGYPMVQMKILGIKNRITYIIPLFLTMLLNPYTIMLSTTYFFPLQISKTNEHSQDLISDKE